MHIMPLYVATLVLLAVSNLPAAIAQEPGSNQATLNFVGADIESVVRAIGHYTGNTFVIDPRVKGTINLVSEKPVTKAQAFTMLTSVLRLQGFAVVRADTFVKVVPEADAKLQSTPIQIGKVHGDQIATQIFHLNHEPAANLVNVLRPLISPNNTINADPANNALVITDYADNLKRLARIIAALDVPAIGTVEVVPLQHAIASDMVPILNRLLDQAGNTPGAQGTQGAQGAVDAGRIMLLADARTNGIIIRAPNPARVTLAQTLIAKLDQPTSLPGNVHVVYLKNAEAAKLALVLRAVMATEAGVTGTGTGSGLTQVSTAATQAPPPNTATTGMQGPPSTPSPAQGPLPSGGVGGYIQADPTTNTLIITANETVYRNLRSIIDQLDARRAQVYVESLIVEVTADKAAEFGIQWAGLSGNSSNNYRVGVLTGFATAGDNLISQVSSIVGTSQTPLPPSNGLTAGLFRQKDGKLSLGALAHALESDVKANILSMPNLITLDNEEARIIVGQNVPFITGQFTTPASGGTAGVNPFQTIERRDIGLSLRVRPQISEGGTVKMAIYQETSAIQESTSSGLITSKRSIDTNVLVDDGQIIVLGGLIEDTLNDSLEKVPGLGDIPLLGYLFKYQTKKRSKTNLLVFLRPTVVRTDMQSEELASDRYDYIRGAQFAIQPEGNAMLPQIDWPKLPPLEDGKPAAGALLRREPYIEERSAPAAPAEAQPNAVPNEPPIINLR
jgi:general secretion pathway protein D